MDGFDVERGEFLSAHSATDEQGQDDVITLAFQLRERTRAGLIAAREEGRIGGRRCKLSDKQQVEIVRMVQKGDKTAAEAARLFNIYPATVCRLLARQATTAT